LLPYQFKQHFIFNISILVLGPFQGIFLPSLSYLDNLKIFWRLFIF